MSLRKMGLSHSNRLGIGFPALQIQQGLVCTNKEGFWVPSCDITANTARRVTDVSR